MAKGDLNETITRAYTMNNRILENKSELKDLGILIDEHLKFSKHFAEKLIELIRLWV